MRSFAVFGASSPGVNFTAISFSVLAAIVSVRATSNAGLSDVIVNSHSVAKTFLNVTAPAPPRTSIGPRGFGGVHRPTTGQTYSPASADTTRIVALTPSPTRSGSNVTSTSASMPSSPAGCAATAAGQENSVAVSGVGLNTIAGVAGHITLVGIFLIWAGRAAFGSIEMPEPKWFLIGIGIAAALFLGGLAIPTVRSMMVRRLLPVISKAFDGVSAVLRRPGKVALLLGGSILLTFSYLVTLYFSISAFGGGLAFATVGAVFLVGSAIAQAAPTPGGLGAVEAALIAGLVAAGLDNTVAVPAVFLYRLFTFWVPILPGWVAFQWLQTNEYI